MRTESPLLLRTCFIQEKEFKFQTRIGEWCIRDDVFGWQIDRLKRCDATLQPLLFVYLFFFAFDFCLFYWISLLRRHCVHRGQPPLKNTSPLPLSCQAPSLPPRSPYIWKLSKPPFLGYHPLYIGFLWTPPLFHPQP